MSENPEADSQSQARSFDGFIDLYSPGSTSVPLLIFKKLWRGGPKWLKQSPPNWKTKSFITVKALPDKNKIPSGDELNELRTGHHRNPEAYRCMLNQSRNLV